MHCFLQGPVRLGKPMQITWHRATIRSKVLQQNTIWWRLQCRDSSWDSTVVAVLAIFSCYTPAWCVWDSNRDYSSSWIVSIILSEILLHFITFVPNFIKKKKAVLFYPLFIDQSELWMCIDYFFLTLNLLTTTIVAPTSNASKWQMGFNSAFKGLTTNQTH